MARETIRLGVERWTRETDEDFQACTLEDISDSIRSVAKAKGPRRQTTTLYLGVRVLEIEVRRVR